jgi:hypothetical protein
MAADPVIRLSATLCNLVGLACDGLIVRVGGARKRMLAAKQQQCEVERRPAEELASRRQKEAQELWRRARRERHRAEFFWREARKERRRAEAAWRRVLTGLDPAAPRTHILAAEGNRLAEILGVLDSDQLSEFESAARHAEAIRGKLWVSWDELLAAATQGVAQHHAYRSARHSF